jgi:hypothetical protein
MQAIKSILTKKSFAKAIGNPVGSKVQEKLIQDQRVKKSPDSGSGT